MDKDLTIKNIEGMYYGIASLDIILKEFNNVTQDAEKEYEDLINQNIKIKDKESFISGFICGKIKASPKVAGSI